MPSEGRVRELWNVVDLVHEMPKLVRVADVVVHKVEQRLDHTNGISVFGDLFDAGLDVVRVDVQLKKVLLRLLPLLFGKLKLLSL